ncbi:MAG: hypothetical protein LBH01_07950 [Verrucomicrobiales bacterium]|jgi:hypothetical protein|nr:hypothetical protein [Verrucomicrobiales bacterium]
MAEKIGNARFKVTRPLTILIRKTKSKQVKFCLPILAICLAVSSAVAANDNQTAAKNQIKIMAKIIKKTANDDSNAKNTLHSEPSVIIEAGQKSTLRICREFRLPAPNPKLDSRQLDVGIILDVQADIQDSKIIYSSLVTIRNFKDGKINTAAGIPVPDHPDKPVASDNYTGYFKTLEFIFTGTAENNKPITAKFDDGLSTAITFTILNPDGSPKK